MGSAALNQRSEVLDIIRGFGLVGVCLANMFYFFNWWYILPPQSSEALLSAPVDRWLLAFIERGVDGKFFGIFTMLFGIGLAISYERHTARGHSFSRHIARRSLFWALLGILHIVLISPSGILLAYGLCGWLLSLSIKWNWQVHMTLIPVCLLVLPLLLYLLNLPPMPGATTLKPWGEVTSQALTAYQGSNYLDIISSNLLLYQHFFLVSWAALSHFLLLVVGGMLAGIVLWKSGMLHQALIPGSYVKVLLVFMFWLPLLEWSSWYLQGSPDRLRQLLLAVTGYVKDLSYSALYLMSLILLFQFGFRRILLPLKYLGQLSATNYVLQALLSALIFYGFGFNQVAQMSPSEVILTVLVLTVLQIGCSRLWLRVYQYGPLEYLVRRFSTPAGVAKARLRRPR